MPDNGTVMASYYKCKKWLQPIRGYQGIYINVAHVQLALVSLK